MNCPIKVLHVIDGLAPGGSERVLVEMVNNLNQQFIVPSVCVTRHDMTLAEAVNGDIQIFQLNRRSRWERGSLKRFGKLIRQNGIDLIHAHGYSSSSFVAAAKTYNFLLTPLIMHAHDCEPPTVRDRLVARSSVSHFIGVAPELVKWAQALLGFSADRVTLLGNAINVKPYENCAPVDFSNYFKVRPRLLGLVVANVRPYKDFETMFKSLALSKYKDDFKILIAGSTENLNYMEQCHRMIGGLGLSERVIFLGTRQDLPRVLASVDFGLLSSKNESGPVALLEYMASSVPFVVTEVGQVAETVANAGMQSVVPRQDPHGFSRALDRLIALPDAERKARGEAGKEFLLEHFSIEARIALLQELYQSLLARKSRAGGGKR